MASSLLRSRMVSFRLSPEEYQRFQKLGKEHHIHSLSDLARKAVEAMVAADQHTDPLALELHDLRAKVRSLSQELDQLSSLLETHNCDGNPQ